MPGGKWVGKELDRSIAAAIAANVPRDQIFADALATYGCSRQTVHRSFHRLAARKIEKPQAPPAAPAKRPKPSSPAPRDGLLQDGIKAAISKVRTLLDELLKRDDPSRLEEFVRSVLRSSIDFADRHGIELEKSRRVEQLAPIEAPRVRTPEVRVPEPQQPPSSAQSFDAPSAGETFGASPRDLRSITTPPTPRRERESRVGMVLDDPEDLRRSSTPRSGRPPQLGMRERGRIGTLPATSPMVRGRPKRSPDQEDLELALQIPRIHGAELAAAIAIAEANKKPGRFPGDVIEEDSVHSIHTLPSFAATSESERSLLRERVRRKKRRKAITA